MPRRSVPDFGSPNQRRRISGRYNGKNSEITISDGKIIGEVTPPENGHLAFFGELDYEIDGLRYHLSTQVRMTE